MTGFFVCEPAPIGDTEFLSSNIAENDHPEYDANIAYVAGDRVIVIATHRVYEAAQNTTGDYPPDNLADPNNDAAPFFWIDLGATNQRAALDTDVAKPTTGNDAITYSFAPSRRTDTVSFLGVDAETVSVSVRDPGLPRRNIVTASHDFASAPWLTPGVQTILTADAAIAPDGTQTAAILSDDGSGGSGAAFIVQEITLSEGVNVLSAFFRLGSGNLSTARIAANGFGRPNGAAFFAADFDLVAGVPLGTFEPGERTCEAVGDGWFRCSCRLEVAGDLVGILRLQKGISYELDGSETVELWGAQAEAGRNLTDYQSIAADGSFSKVVYDVTEQTIDTSDVTGWLDFFTFVPDILRIVTFHDVPAVLGTEIDITVAAPGKAVSLERLFLGAARMVGIPQVGTEIQFRDFSTKERDEVFGGFTIVRRSTASGARVNLAIREGDETRVQRLVRSLRVTPTLWFEGKARVGKAVIIYGFLSGDFRIIRDFGLSAATLEIEGLTENDQ